MNGQSKKPLISVNGVRQAERRFKRLIFWEGILLELSSGTNEKATNQNKA